MNDTKPIHNWPKDDTHYFGEWQPMSKNQHYRVCLDPQCKHVEVKTAPKG